MANNLLTGLAIYLKCLDLTEATGALSDLTNDGSVTFGPGAIAGEGLAAFNGGFLSHPATPMFADWSADFTARMIYQSSGLASSSFSMGENNDAGFDFGPDTGPGVFCEIPGSDGSFPSHSTADDLNDGLPHHVIFRWTSATKQLALFVDGVKSTSTSAVAAGPADSTNALNWNGTGPASAGSLALWRGRALSDADCALLHGGGSFLGVASFDNGTAGGAQTFLDTFTGAANTDLSTHALDSGQAWVYANYNAENSGDPTLYPHTELDGLGNGRPSGAATDTGWATVLVDQLCNSGVQRIGINFTPDMSSMSYMELHARDNNAADQSSLDYCAIGYSTLLQKWTLTGSGSDFGSTVDQTLVTGQTYRVELEVTDTVVRWYLDGVLQTTSAHYPSTPKGYVGFWFIRNVGDAGNAGVVDNFGAAIAAPSAGGATGRHPRWITLSSHRLSIS